MRFIGKLEPGHLPLKNTRKSETNLFRSVTSYHLSRQNHITHNGGIRNITEWKLVTRAGFKRFRWWHAPVILVPIAIGAFVHWLNKPFPPPVVSLSFVGYKSTPTNTYALMCLSNSGPATIYFDPWFWHAEFRTPCGLTTNDSRGAGISVSYLGTLPGSNEFFGVPIPAKSTNWQVETECSYFMKRHVRLEIGEWLVRNNVQLDFLWKPLEAIGPVLEKLFPEPKSDWVVTSTGWMTNLPPPNTRSH